MQIKEFDLKINPIEIFQNFLEDDYPVFLESQMDFEKLGRYSIIASNPFLKVKSKSSELIIETKDKRKVVCERDILKELEHILNRYRVDYDGELPFIGGAIGHFSYEFLKEIEDIELSSEDFLKIPDMNFGIYNEVVIIDNLLKKVYIISHNFIYRENGWLEELERRINSSFIYKEIEDFDDKECEIKPLISKERYLKDIDIIKENILNGNVYQINYTQKFETFLNKTSFSLYKRLSDTNKAPFASFLSFGDYEIVCSSPERFIKVSKNRIETRPIKGTVARGKDGREDRENREFLKSSEKNRAELLMIVDLERNDLGKICKAGSVTVEELFYIEEYATLFQQIANVSGVLRENIGVSEIFKAMFPGGSITGAPKRTAIELIDKLEEKTRDIYTGTIGYIGFNGDMDFNIVIRTVVCKEGKAYYQVGGGIVWDSDAIDEYEESLLKGKALREALLWRE